MVDIGACVTSFSEELLVPFTEIFDVSVSFLKLHFLSLFNCSQNQIMILGTVILLTFIHLVACCIRLCDSIKKVSLEYQKMTYVVNGSQQIRIEVTLEVRFKIVSVLKINLILIRIDHLNLGMLIDSLGTLIERIKLKLVIMVCKNYVVPVRHIDGSIGIVGNAEILFQHSILKSRIPPMELLKHFSRKLSVSLRLVILFIRCCIRNAYFKLTVSLFFYRLKHLSQKLFRRFINRYNYGKLWSDGKCLTALSVELFLSYLFPLVPLVIIIVFLYTL